MPAFSSFLRMGMLFYGATIFALWGQSTASPPAATSSQPLQTSQNQTIIQAFQAEQVALFQEREALVAQGATSAQLIAWRQANAARFAAQVQRAQALSAAVAGQPMPVLAPLATNTNASAATTAFLAAQLALANARVHLHNQMLQNLPASATFAQFGASDAQEEQLFRQQNAANLQSRDQRMQALANEVAQRPVPLPGPFVLPPNISPQLAAFLTAKDRLIRDEITASNQNLSPDPAVRAAALKLWYQQNAARLLQVQQLALAVPSSN